MTLRIGDQLVTGNGEVTWTVTDITIDLTSGTTFVDLSSHHRDSQGKRPIHLSSPAIQRRLVDGFLRFV